MSIFRKKGSRVDPEEIIRQADESLTKTAERQTHVNALTSYLNWRNGENNFGRDFDISLVPRGAIE